MLRLFIVIAISCICAGFLYVGALLSWAYSPAHAYVSPLNRYVHFFVILFLSIAALEIVRAFKSKLRGGRYLGAQSFIDLALVTLVVSTLCIGKIEIKAVKTVELGHQSLTFSTLDYPVGNEFGHGATPLFEFDEDDKIHSVYFQWENSYGFDDIFESGQARSFFSAVHAQDSPNLKDVDFSDGEFSTRHDRVYLHEGDYVLEFFPTHGLSNEEDVRFLQFIKDNAAQIRADFRPHLVPTLMK